MTEHDWQEIESTLDARIKANQLHIHTTDLNDAASVFLDNVRTPRMSRKRYRTGSVTQYKGSTDICDYYVHTISLEAY